MEKYDEVIHLVRIERRVVWPGKGKSRERVGNIWVRDAALPDERPHIRPCVTSKMPVLSSKGLGTAVVEEGKGRRRNRTAMVVVSIQCGLRRLQPGASLRVWLRLARESWRQTLTAEVGYPQAEFGYHFDRFEHILSSQEDG